MTSGGEALEPGPVGLELAPLEEVLEMSEHDFAGQFVVAAPLCAFDRIAVVAVGLVPVSRESNRFEAGPRTEPAVGVHVEGTR